MIEMLQYDTLYYMTHVFIWLLLGVQIILLAIVVRILFRVVPVIFYFHKPLPYVPSHHRVVQGIVKSKVLEDKKNIIDLGAGPGSFMRSLAKHYPAAQFSGVELLRSLVWLSKFYTIGFKNRMTIVQGDMFEFPINQADAIIGFWIPNLIPKIFEKLKKECQPGCVVISNMFPLPASDLFTEEVITAKKDKIYIYQRI